MQEITFHQEVLNDSVQSKYFDPNVLSLTVFDDWMRIHMNDDTAADLFTEGAHHHSISVVLLLSHVKRRITWSLQNCKQCISVKNNWIL